RINVEYVCALGAKEFSADALKAASEYAKLGADKLQEKIPEAIEAGKDFAGKAVGVGEEYGKIALEEGEKLASKAFAEDGYFVLIIENFDVVLVKWDEKYPYGDNQDQFKKFAENAANTKQLLLVEVPVTDYGDKENEDLAKRFNVEKADFPAYKLFLKGKSKPIDHTGDRTEVGLKQFLTQHTNLWFGLPGTLEQMDLLARQFFDLLSSTDDTHDQEKKTLFEKAKEQMKAMTNKNDQRSGESYVKIMEKMLEQGPEFLKREARRVQNLLKGKITTEKKEELNYRQNILLSFKSLKDAVIDPIVDKVSDIKESVVDTANDIKDKIKPEL
ncbi:unnamed protein product, partial [Didymodactylos carnosus]